MLAEAKNDQIRFKSNLGEIKKGNKKKRSKEQKSALYNTDMFYKARNEAINFLMNTLQWYLNQHLKQKNESKGLKIKASNNSENLLNEIKQIV